MNTKVIIIGVMVVATNLLFSGCSDFLDKQPYGIETRDDFFKTSDQAIKATTAAYDAIGWYYSQEVDEWQFGDICSDDAEKGGENLADFAELQGFKNFNGVSTFNNLFLRWSEYYQGVLRANQVIENVPGIKMDTKVRDRLVGEATFIRGYIYFQLVKTFGEVPLILKELSPTEYCQPKATMEECWAQIEKDFKQAAEVLPDKTEYDATDMGRATKGAANSFLAKAYIFQSKWELAEKVANDVIISMQYDLEPNYADVFTLSHENGIESIFDIQHITVSTGQWGDQNEGCITSIYTGSRNADWFSGWGFNCPTQNFVDEFEEGDPRLAASVIFDKDTIWKGTPAEEIADNGKSATGMHARKYMLEYMDPQPAMSNQPANWRAMRFADVILFHAEAANENGNVAVALGSLNRVRARVGLSEVTTTDQDELRNAIYHERRVELGLEGHRFFDLVRQGRAADVLGENGFREGKHEYFPIPQSELDVCDKLKQNNYYD